MTKRIYIRNLSDDIDSTELETMFASVGKVENASVEIKNIRGSDYRVGYVEMETEQQTLDSILRFNGLKKNGVVLIVSEDKPHVPDPNFKLKSTKSVSTAKRKN